MTEKDTGPILLSSGEFDTLHGNNRAPAEVLRQRQKLIVSCAAGAGVLLCMLLLFDRCEKASDAERLKLANGAIEYELASLKAQVASMDSLVKDLHVDRARLEKQSDAQADAEKRAGILEGVLAESIKREVKNGDAKLTKKGAIVTAMIEGWAVLDDTDVSVRGVDLLVRVAQVLADPELSAEHIVVTGYTDPADKDPWVTSASSAASVAAFLEENDIPAPRLEAIGRGGNDPIAKNRGKNRRVEIAVEYR